MAHRLLPLVVLILWLLPHAAASSPSPPVDYSVDVVGEPLVGKEFSLLMTARADFHDGNVTLRLQAPAGIALSSAPEWTFEAVRGGTYQRAWTLRVTEPGAWALQWVYPDAETAPLGYGPVAHCCVRVWSTEETARSGSGWQHLFDDAGARGEVRGAENKNGTWTATYVVAPKARWLQHAELQVRLNGVDGQASDQGPGDRVFRVQQTSGFQDAGGFSFIGRTHATLAYLRLEGEPIVEQYEVECSAFYVTSGWQRDLPGGGAHACSEQVWYAPAPTPLVAVLAVLALAASWRRR